MAIAKRHCTEEQLINDPSLKFNGYKKWEVLWSDFHNCLVRFCHYSESGNIWVAAVNSIAYLPDSVNPLKVRRPTV